MNTINHHMHVGAYEIVHVNLFAFFFLSFSQFNFYFFAISFTHAHTLNQWKQQQNDNNEQRIDLFR